MSRSESSNEKIAPEQKPLLDTAAVSVPAAIEQQHASNATRLFGCLMQAGSIIVKPFQLAYNHPKKAMLLLTLGANAVAQSCVNGAGDFAGRPQQYCTDAANTIGKNTAAVTGVAGTLFALASHYITREVGLYREQQNTAGPRM